MNTYTFLRSLLLMPLVVPLLVGGLWMALHYANAPIAGELSLSGLVVIKSLLFGGVPYLITAVVLWNRIGRCTSRNSVIVLIFTAPLFFIPMQVFAMLLLSLLLSSVEASLGDKLTEGAFLGLMTTIYVLIFGYFYATCSAVIYLGTVRLGLVSGFASDKLHHAVTNA